VDLLDLVSLANQFCQEGLLTRLLCGLGSRGLPSGLEIPEALEHLVYLEGKPHRNTYYITYSGVLISGICDKQSKGRSWESICPSLASKLEKSLWIN
jgi:hypothetical protein